MPFGEENENDLILGFGLDFTLILTATRVGKRENKTAAKAWNTLTHTSQKKNCDNVHYTHVPVQTPKNQ